ncbi:response regulator [Pleurocapsales cyanobacterium LEGE 06147]|nr:response regulator [Pleurocapsales cyanobacterium LEGE 06147]
MYKNDGLVINLPFLQGLRVLVVDNNVDCCDLIELLLQLYGVEVRKAFLAQQALKIFVEWQPDILVSDVALPEVDGLTLVQQARTISATRGKVLLGIAVTGYINEETRQLALSGGFDFWFTKPLDLNDFVTVLVYSAIERFLFAITHRTSSNFVTIAI